MKNILITVASILLLTINVWAQKAGNAILMDGIDDFVRVPHQLILNPGTGSWTICLWIKPPNEEQRIPLLVKRYPEEGYNQYSLGIADTEAHNPAPGKRIYSNYIDSSGVSERSGYMPDEFVDGNWHHIAFVADKNADSIFTYINGIKLDFIIQYNFGTWPDVGNLEDLFIGHNDNIHFFKGDMDELSIWNKALSYNQINFVMNDTLGSEFYSSIDSGLVAYYRFDEFEDLGVGSAGTDDIRDLSFWGNHGNAEGNPQLVPSGILVSVEENPSVASSFKLEQNYPNPFNPSTQISYTIQMEGFASLKVYDVLGSEVATLVNEEKPAGQYEIQFIGEGLTSGVYFYQLKAENFVETKKMLLIK